MPCKIKSTLIFARQFLTYAGERIHLCGGAYTFMRGCVYIYAGERIHLCGGAYTFMRGCVYIYAGERIHLCGGTQNCIFFRTIQFNYNYNLITMLFLTSVLESTSSNDLIKPFFTQLSKNVFTIISLSRLSAVRFFFPVASM